MIYKVVFSNLLISPTVLSQKLYPLYYLRQRTYISVVGYLSHCSVKNELTNLTEDNSPWTKLNVFFYFSQNRHQFETYFVNRFYWKTCERNININKSEAEVRRFPRKQGGWARPQAETVLVLWSKGRRGPLKYAERIGPIKRFGWA